MLFTMIRFEKQKGRPDYCLAEHPNDIRLIESNEVSRLTGRLNLPKPTMQLRVSIALYFPDKNDLLTFSILNRSRVL